MIILLPSLTMKNIIQKRAVIPVNTPKTYVNTKSQTRLLSIDMIYFFKNFWKINPVCMVTLLSLPPPTYTEGGAKMQQKWPIIGHTNCVPEVMTKTGQCLQGITR